MADQRPDTPSSQQAPEQQSTQQARPDAPQARPTSGEESNIDPSPGAPAPTRSRGDRPASGGGQSRRPVGSAKDGDPRKIEENRKRMGVGSDHRTEAMRKGGRGTFP